MCALGRQLAPHGVRINSVLLAGGEHHSSAGDAAEVSLSSDASSEVQSCRHTLAPARTCLQTVQTEVVHR